MALDATAKSVVHNAIFIPRCVAETLGVFSQMNQLGALSTGPAARFRTTQPGRQASS